MEYIIRTNYFEGPLELLIELIKKREMNIFDLQISEITHDFLESIRAMEKADFEVTSDFMELASVLIGIKIKMLLPADAEREDPRNDLVEQLLDYQHYKESIEKLKELKELEHKLFKRKDDTKITRRKKGTIEDIIRSYQSIILKNETKENLNKSRLKDLASEMMRRRYTVEEQTEMLKERLDLSAQPVQRIFGDLSNREEMIVTFSALLELVKTQYVSIFLDKDEVFIEKKEVKSK